MNGEILREYFFDFLRLSCGNGLLEEFNFFMAVCKPPTSVWAEDLVGSSQKVVDRLKGYGVADRWEDHKVVD